MLNFVILTHVDTKVTIFDLHKSGPTAFGSIRETFHYNTFHVIRDCGRTHINGFYALHSRFNHSCLPNCIVPDNDGTVLESYATRDIEAGEDLFLAGDMRSMAPVVPDRELNGAAEDQALPTTTWMVYALLYLVFLEQEGILGSGQVERMDAAIANFMERFKTRSNIRVARLAMQQPTLLGKLRVACEMYGRPDKADPKVAKRFYIRAGRA